MSEVKVLVSINDEHLSRFTEVADQCRAAGMNIDGELDAIGLITGSIDAAKIQAVEELEGVNHIEASRDSQIAPPESPIQ